MFELDKRLAADTCWLGDLPLCRILLMLDANYPWVILVPRRAGLTELHELSESDRLQFMRESGAVADIMKREFSADKMNIAALGNMVSQLHIHHIARFHDDAAWPRPVWGCVAPVPYENTLLQERASTLKQVFSDASLHFEAQE